VCFGAMSSIVYETSIVTFKIAKHVLLFSSVKRTIGRMFILNLVEVFIY
jgi:hypothetical protein